MLPNTTLLVRTTSTNLLLIHSVTAYLYTWPSWGKKRALVFVYHDRSIYIIASVWSILHTVCMTLLIYNEKYLTEWSVNYDWVCKRCVRNDYFPERVYFIWSIVRFVHTSVRYLFCGPQLQTYLRYSSKSVYWCNNLNTCLDKWLATYGDVLREDLPVCERYSRSMYDHHCDMFRLPNIYAFSINLWNGHRIKLQ